MKTIRRVLFGTAFLAAALLLSRYSADLPRSAWFAKANAMAGAALCGGAVVTLLCHSLRIPEERFNAAWWKLGSILAPLGVALSWLSLALFPRMAAKPLAWFLTIGCTLCLMLFLRIKKSLTQNTIPG